MKQIKRMQRIKNGVRHDASSNIYNLSSSLSCGSYMQDRCKYLFIHSDPQVLEAVTKVMSLFGIWDIVRLDVDRILVIAKTTREGTEAFRMMRLARTPKLEKIFFDTLDLYNANDDINIYNAFVTCCFPKKGNNASGSRQRSYYSSSMDTVSTAYWPLFIRDADHLRENIGSVKQSNFIFARRNNVGSYVTNNVPVDFFENANTYREVYDRFYKPQINEGQS